MREICTSGLMRGMWKRGTPVNGNKRHRLVATRRQTETALSLEQPRHISTLRDAGRRSAPYQTFKFETQQPVMLAGSSRPTAVEQIS